MAADYEGTIVTFYSYKGGTGRTMALANVAWILASNGCRVLAVDWDLEAPGLHKFFRPFLDDKVLTETPGVHNLCVSFALEAARRAKDGDRLTDDDAWHDAFVRLDSYIVRVGWDFSKGGGVLDLMPAGQSNTYYPNASIDWNRFYEKLDGSVFFDALRASMKQSYDYVLIDSRTGRSDIGDICSVQLPDTLVSCFTMSDQSIEGASTAAARIADNYTRGIRILPVPMRLDTAEKERLDIGRATAQAKFDRFITHVPADERDRYWRQVEVPYVPYYSYEEILAVFGDRANSPNTVLSSFERLTGEITGGTVTHLGAISEEVRQRHLQEFQRRRPARPADVFLSYVPEDRPWADWLRQLLKDAGCRIVSRPEGADSTAEAYSATGRNVREATRTVAVLSDAYMKSAEFEAVREELKASDPVGLHHLIVPICVGSSTFGNPFPNRAAADLRQLDEQAARQAVWRVLDLAPAEHASDGEEQDGPRYPSANPPVWNVPTRNPTFTGRAEILDRLRDELRRGRSAALLQVLHGLGGVGKTQIALEFAHRFKADYDIVWWIRSQEPNRAAAQLADLGRNLGLPVTNVAEASAATVERLRRGDPHKRSLLIFDNAEAKDLDALRPLIPTGGAAHVLITSRNRELEALGTSTIDINVFSRSESIAHLQRHIPKLPNHDADQLSETLGDLPIAVELAAAWLKETAIPVGAYIKRLAQDPGSVLKESSSGYSESVLVVWRATIDELRSQSPTAVRLLELCAFFGPEPISTSLVYSDEFISSLQQFDPTLEGERMMIDRFIRDLGRFALVRIDLGEASIQVHRLLQQLVQGDMDVEHQKQMRRTVRRILTKMRPGDGDVDNPDQWDRYSVIWPHLYVARADAAKDGATRRLMVDRVRYLAIRGQIDESLQLALRMQKAWEQDSDADEMRLLELRCEIANIYRQSGRADESFAIDTNVYEQQLNSVGPVHLHTLRTAGSLASDLRSLGRWNESLDRDRETYELMAGAFGEDHQRTLWAANNLALSLRITGQSYAARDMDQKVLDRRRTNLGNGHHLTLVSALNLARDLDDCGQYADSLFLVSGTAELCREQLGEDAPTTLDTDKQVAVAERRLGRHESARAKAENVYKRWVDVLGEDGPATLSSAVTLAAHEAATGDVVIAAERISLVHRRYLASLGPAHPHTLSVENNRAVYLRRTGDWSRAQTFARESNDGLAHALGAQHPVTLASTMNLANVLADSGDLSTASDLLSRALEGFRLVLGGTHPDTLCCTANLASVTYELGDHADAAALARPTIEAIKRAYADDHPVVVALGQWTRIDRDVELYRT